MIDAKDKKALYVNEAYETITGRSCKSLIENPSSYEELIHPDDRGHVLTKLEEAVQNGRFGFGCVAFQSATARAGSPAW